MPFFTNPSFLASHVVVCMWMLVQSHHCHLSTTLNEHVRQDQETSFGIGNDTHMHMYFLVH